MSFDWKQILLALMGKKQIEDNICNTNRSRKLYFTGHEQLSISSKTNATADEVTKAAYNIMQKYKNQPELILKYMESKGTKIVVSKMLLPLLNFLGYEEGFIPSHSSFKALILNIAISKVLKQKLNCSTKVPDLFLICRKELSLYFLAYQFHHWLSYQYKLPGYDFATMCLFRTTMNTNANLSVLSINQILSIKDAIDRDKQALDFVTKFTREQVGAKKRLEEMLNGKTVKI